MLRPYESVIICHPEATAEEQKALFNKNKNIIEANKGSIHNVDTWGRRRLANPIRGEKAGVYFYSTFEASPEAITELERTMKINDKVLRYSHLRLDDRFSLDKHLQAFRDRIADSLAKKEKDRDFRKKKFAGAERTRERSDAVPRNNA